MRLLILGGKGMAGHVITKYFQGKEGYEVYYTSRDQTDTNGIFLDVTNSQEVEKVIENIRPHITVNCTGILNQHATDDPFLAFQVNSILPQQLVKLTERYGGKLVQISTDCVFSGEKGEYTETDDPDGTSVYSESKKLGEILSDKHVTIRTSIIGPELKDNGIGLFLWFMKQKGEVSGYTKALWNGVTTLELAKAIEKIIEHHVTGLYHLCSETKISKYELLTIIKEVFEKEDVEISPDDSKVIDRTLKNTRSDFQYDVPDYKEMIFELKDWMRQS
ncbi:SDR family oxidoreductase [Alkalihalobacillus sp. LMS39]|uniref:dTDP-4-dehydrorhamnose reductase family protein n=1 Tax=Alkalihalobacillus sp. LMS39 TaxID=2924032 RepID=UPI001FB35872|nr:SDR family oxidoreductase [Alkalihalobacillus sp. LMS39]UOE92730.1 SDR family oxidoreductase [Alkalihalobacillus sp. LMS39]